MLIDYSENMIFLTPDDEAESRKIMNVLNENDLFTNNNAGFKTGRWFVKSRFLDKLNKALVPLKNNIRLSDDFRDYVNLFRNQASSDGKDTVKIIYGANQCKIIGPKRSVPDGKIEKKTRFFFQGAVNCKSYKEQRWDGYICLYNKFKRTFPSGLIDRVVSVFKSEGINVVVEQAFSYPKRQFDWKVDDGITPDPDQIEAVNAALNGKRGVLKAPTGFGKTAILAKRLTAGFGVPTLFIANKKILLDDAAEEFVSGIKGLSCVGALKDGVFDKDILKNCEHPQITSPVIVATIQSLDARLKDVRTAPVLKDWLNNVCKFVMVDECQAVGTKTWDDVLNECHAPYRIFLSATPWRSDGATLKIESQSGPTLFTTSAEQQIENNRLCELDVFYHKFDHQMFNDGDNGIPYAEAYANFIAGNEKRNRLIIDLALKLVAEDRLTLVLVTSIDHGNILKSMFIESGVAPDDIRFIWGGSKNSERKSGIADFKEGKFKILIGSTIFDMGANIPAISGLVIAGAGNAETTIIQRVGRAARNCDFDKVLGYTPKFMQGESRKASVIYDIADCNICYFRKQARNRYYTLKKEYGADRVHLVDFRVGELSPPKRNKDDKPMSDMKFGESGKSIAEFLEEFKEFKK